MQVSYVVIHMFVMI